MESDFYSFLSSFIDSLPLPAIIVDSSLVVRASTQIYHQRIAPGARVILGKTRLHDLPGWSDPDQIPFVDALATGQKPDASTTVTLPDGMVVAVHASYYEALHASTAELPSFTMLQFGTGTHDIGHMATAVFQQARIMFYVYDVQEHRFLMRTPLFDGLSFDPPGPYSASPDRFLSSVHEADRSRVQQMLTRLRSGQPASVEYRAILQGKEYYWNVHTVPFLKNGEPAHLIGLIQDVTAEREQIAIQQKLSAELAQAEREKAVLHAKAGFLSLVSHEFRTPLAIIQTSSELLRYHYEKMPQERRDKHFNQIETQVASLTLMLNEILHIGRIGTETFEANARRIFIEQFCRDVARSVQTETGGTHHILFSSQGVARPLIVDREYLEHTMSHIIRNAILYAPDNDQIEIDIVTGEETVTIYVRDHGMGIPPEDQPHVFEFFYRGSNTLDIPGNGLGLSLARQVIELHHGTISIESTPGEGTIITVILPLSNGLSDQTPHGR